MAVTVTRGVAEQLDELEPLWLALHAEHEASDPGIEGFSPRTGAESWPRRRAMYADWLGRPGSFVLVARDDPTGLAVGYAMVCLRGGSLVWDTGERCAELESLSVLPEHRNRGVGRMLLEAAYAELRRLGVDALFIDVLVTNEGARRLYEREGFRPWVTTMLGRVPGAGPA